MKILFIDEDAEAVKDGIECLKEAGHDCLRIDFKDIEETLKTYPPDIIVLDMMDGGESIDPEGIGGKRTFDFIWDIKFCPVVVYSANPSLIDDIDSEKSKNPLVQKVQKGSGSDEKLREEINKLLPCVEGINGIINDVNNVLQVTLKKVATHIASQDGIEEIATAIQYMGRRRLAAQIDDAIFLRPKLHPWEQYIYPPLDNYPKMGDILRGISDDPKKPESYRVVLTPSCDMVKTGSRKPNITEVLCSYCSKVDVVFPSDIGAKKVSEKLPAMLSQGYHKQYLFVPGLSNVIPPMVADFKKLELIPYDSIANESAEGIKFIRVASVDSPFREQTMWTYMSTVGRPGVPDRDFEIWAKQYLNDTGEKGEKK